MISDVSVVESAVGAAPGSGGSKLGGQCQQCLRKRRCPLGAEDGCVPVRGSMSFF